MLRVAILATLLLGYVSSTVAQSINNEDLKTLVVTASRVPVSAKLSGNSYTIIDRETLEQRQTSTLSGILREVPGFAVNRGGVLGSTTQIRVRGAEGNQVLVFIDGMEVNDLAQGGEFNFAHLTSADIERVEIIRGPQSALWGSDALGGVINISTRRGEGALKVSAYAEGGSFETKQGGGNISMGADNYHFNLAGSYLDSKGDNISRANDEDDGYENTTISVSAGYSPLHNLSFDFAGRLTDASNEFDETDFFTTGLPVDTDSETRTSQNYSRIQARLSLYEGLWEHKAGFALTNTDNDNFLNAIESSSTQGKKHKFDYQTSLFLETAQISNEAHIITFALEHEIEDFAQRGPVAFGSDPNQDLKTKSSSYIGEYRITFSDNLSLSGGIRHDDNSEFLNATTYRGTAAYLFDENGLRLHASYGTGIKNPTFTERFGFFSSSLFTPFIGNPNLEPEKSRGWEIGMDKSFFDNRFSLGLTYFNEQLEDEINGFFFDVATFTATSINETGKSRRKGLELTGRALLSNELSLSGNYTYLNATQPDGFGGKEREVRRPKHTGNININYDFLNQRANLNLNLNYNGKQGDVFFEPPFFAREIVPLDSFTLVNISASYKFSEMLSIYGRVENLLDENYEEVFGYQGTGLGVFAGVKMNFKP
jgi:vitamin B12 transporter